MAPGCSYLLPIRRTTYSAPETEELRAYFLSLAPTGCELLVIDGSPDAVFQQHAQAWGKICRHLPVERRFGFRNDKVNGVHTGVAAAQGDKIILADDDIRYTPDEIAAVLALLDRFEVVRPQNFLQPLPWWGKTEAARMLVNRATLRTADYPGTCAFRRATMLAHGEYDGDVLFDNEEILRNFAAQGCRITYETDLFVRKRPPHFRKWLEQRPRQAYEDFGLRGKTALFLALPFAVILPAICFGWAGAGRSVALLAIVAILVAEVGRRRGRAAEFFPFRVSFFAPLWITERSLSTYLALYWFFRHGGYPFGDRFLSRGVGRAWKIGGRLAAAQVRPR